MQDKVGLPSFQASRTRFSKDSKIQYVCLLTIEGIPYYAGVLPARLFQIKHTLFSLPFLPVSFLFSSLPKRKEKVRDTWQCYASKKMYEVAKRILDSGVFTARFGEILLLVGWN